YFDAFAGTGERTERVEARGADLVSEPVEESVTRRRGSAKIAIDIDPPFDQLIFVEKRKRSVAALNKLRTQYSNLTIAIIAADANQEIQAIAARANWLANRAVMFLDPYGMTVEWETLKAIAATQAIDVWYLFSLSGLYRQAARSAEAID